MSGVATRSGQHRAAAAIVVLAVLSVVLAGWSGPTSAQATADPVPAATAPATDAHGPQLTGRAEPPMAQRIIDSLIWGWLLVVLVGGIALWVWSGHRRPQDEARDGDPPPGRPAGPR
jgi:hypothetical protein